jgi:hypothetical protein
MSNYVRRILAFSCLLAGLLVFGKLARHASRLEAPRDRPSQSDASDSTYQSEKARLTTKYAADSEASALLTRVLEKYAQTAVNLERTDGLRGLKLLDLMDLEALYLYERYPRDFRRLCELVDDRAAAKILLTWRDYLGLKRADEVDRSLWIAELERLSPSRRMLVEKIPELLPLMMSEPEAVAALVERMADEPQELRDAVVALQLVSLKEGPRSLRRVVDTLEKHPKWALEALRRRGPEGLLLVHLFGDVIERLGRDALLDDALVALHVACDDMQEYLKDHSPDTLASHIRHLSAAGLLMRTADHPNSLKMTLEFGELGERALRLAGADSAEVVYQVYTDPLLRRQAVESLAQHGPIASVILEKYATDSQFREILRRDGSAVIPPIAQSDLTPEFVARLREKKDRSATEVLALGVMSLSGDNGQATIRMIYEDGLPRASQVHSTGVSAVEFLPLYDLIHLASVLGNGYAPTSGEWSWAMFDGAFVVADVLGLMTLQPEAVAASEVARSQVKAIARTTAREGADAAVSGVARTGAELGGQASTLAARRAGRWYSVRSAGGLGHVLKQFPQAMNKMGLDSLEAVVRPLARKAGVTLSRFEPLRFLKDGREVLMRVPPGRGMKYLAIESAQAGVGLAAYWKMEEHLSSRRGEFGDTTNR